MRRITKEIGFAVYFVLLANIGGEEINLMDTFLYEIGLT